MSERLRVALWVRVLDLMCVLLASLGAIVAVSGGFRLHFGGMRIGATRPFRLLLWALAVGIARHVAVPREPLYREAPRRLGAWSRLPAVRTAAAAVIGTRPAVLFVGYAA